jgi:Flp pilus assembly pilin Flp
MEENMFRQSRTENSYELKAFFTRSLSHRLRRGLRAFHHEERGASGSIDNVMMVFVAALILVGLITLVNDNVWTAVTDKITELFGSTIG